MFFGTEKGEGTKGGRHLCSGEIAPCRSLEHEAGCARNREGDGAGQSQQGDSNPEILKEEESVQRRDEETGSPTGRGRGNDKVRGRERERNRAETER